MKFKRTLVQSEARVQSKRLQRKLSQTPEHASIDDTPDFHDPFSDLSLFLSKHIKRALPELGQSPKWTLKTQEKLIQTIAPTFQKSFPQYRLGVAALKKVFEKLLSIKEIFKQEKEAFSQDGK